MTPMIRVLRRVFFRPDAEDQDRRLRETEVRVDHAARVLGNAMGHLEESSGRLRAARESFVDSQMVEMIRQLSARMDEP